MNNGTINDKEILYKISKTLLYIIDYECYTYGFKDECDLAEEIVKQYEQNEEGTL